jgi:RNA polymerase sigma-70 factor (ECF subfamily)
MAGHESAELELAGRFEQDAAACARWPTGCCGLLGEADDAVQEAWLRLADTADDEIENLDGSLTTVTSRILRLAPVRAARYAGTPSAGVLLFRHDMVHAR